MSDGKHDKSGDGSGKYDHSKTVDPNKSGGGGKHSGGKDQGGGSKGSGGKK